jgi:hypothetical protein
MFLRNLCISSLLPVFDMAKKFRPYSLVRSETYLYFFGGTPRWPLRVSSPFMLDGTHALARIITSLIGNAFLYGVMRYQSN